MALQGLTVNSRGQLLLNGSRFRNIGINWPGAILPLTQSALPSITYTSGADQDAVIAALVAMKCKVVRVKICAYWPASWTNSLQGGLAWNNGGAAAARATYYSTRIDPLVAKCRAAGIGIIFNFFFRIANVPDLVGDNNRQWLVGGSNTRTYATTLTNEIVTRYLTEEAVYGWEFSNELNHYSNAPDARMGNWPGVDVGKGSAASYTAANTVWNREELASVMAWWYGVVRAIDSQRIVLTGNGPNTYNREDGAQGIPATLRDMHREQVRDNPTNCGSIHYYGGINAGSRGLRGIGPYLVGVRTEQRTAGRAFVMGEFGNQPWEITSGSGTGSVVTLGFGSAVPLDVGDDFTLTDAGAYNGSYTAATVSADGRTITAAGAATGSISSGELQHMTPTKLARVLNEIIDSDADLALIWQIGTEATIPVYESVLDPLNAGQPSVIAAANARLGW